MTHPIGPALASIYYLASHINAVLKPDFLFFFLASGSDF